MIGEHSGGLFLPSLTLAWNTFFLNQKSKINVSILEIDFSRLEKAMDDNSLENENLLGDCLIHVLNYDRGTEEIILKSHPDVLLTGPIKTFFIEASMIQLFPIILLLTMSVLKLRAFHKIQSDAKVDLVCHPVLPWILRSRL